MAQRWRYRVFVPMALPPDAKSSGQVEQQARGGSEGVGFGDWSGGHHRQFQ
jgi:hypothetical protein